MATLLYSSTAAMTTIRPKRTGRTMVGRLDLAAAREMWKEWCLSSTIHGIRYLALWYVVMGAGKDRAPKAEKRA